MQETPVGVIAHGRVHGADEKEVKYYKQVLSSDSSMEGGDGSEPKDQDAKPPASISSSSDRALTQELLKKLFCAFQNILDIIHCFDLRHVGI